jgi:hypothetical protein
VLSWSFFSRLPLQSRTGAQLIVIGVVFSWVSNVSEVARRWIAG